MVFFLILTKYHQASWLRVNKEEPGIVLYKKDFSNIKGWKKCNKKGREYTKFKNVKTLM